MNVLNVGTMQFQGWKMAKYNVLLIFNKNDYHLNVESLVEVEFC